MERKRLSKEKRRKQIKEIALKLFVDKGYSKITMEEIVQAVGVSKGGMYHHFSNKEEIFLELLRDGDEYRKDIVQKSMRENLLSRRDKIVDILLERILDKNPYKDLYTVFLIEMINLKCYLKKYMMKVMITLWNLLKRKDWRNTMQ